MPNNEFHEVVQIVRPPAPELPRAEQLAAERQKTFHSHEPVQVQPGPPNPGREFTPVPPEPVPARMDRAGVCVLDERGGHQVLGVQCPHFKDWNRDEVIEVTF